MKAGHENQEIQGLLKRVVATGTKPEYYRLELLVNHQGEGEMPSPHDET